MKTKSKKWQRVVELIFHGERFRGAGIDAGALKEIITFQEIIAETAKIIWRRNNPRRKRLLRGFEKLVTLRLTEIKPGSAGVPLALPVLADEQKEFREGPLPEAKEAVEKTYETIYAAAYKKPLPEDVPNEILTLYNEFGKTLGPGEALFVSMMRRGRKRAKFDLTVRKRITEYVPPTYDDTTELVGTVLAADVKKGMFLIYPDIYKGFAVNLPPEAEITVTTALRDHEKLRLKVKGKGVFSPDGSLLRISEAFEITTIEGIKTLYDETAKPIWEVINEIAKTIPKSELEKIPKDASTNLDFYLYGIKET